MEILVLVVVFLAALAVSGFLVGAFAGPMDAVLTRLIPGDMAAAWSKYAKFALFVASLGGGMRLPEIQGYVTTARAGAEGPAVPAINVGQCLVEVFRTLMGSLGAASWTLLFFFGGTLAAYAMLEVYSSLKPPPSARHEEDRRPAYPSRH